MNTQITLSIAQSLMYSLIGWVTRLVGIAVVIGVSVGRPILGYSPGLAAGLDAEQLWIMAGNGEGESALHLVTDEAAARGGWMPAPGDTVVFDPDLSRFTRGAVLMIDTPPVECADPRLSRGLDTCTRDFARQQNLVRFGTALFATPAQDGSQTPRAAADDLLSTYIEEVAHSWQEYLFETEGRGSGVRTHFTTWEEGYYWSAGLEYQAKRYVLSLDGSLLALSPQEHAQLLSDICVGGQIEYANPIGQHVSSFGPPPDWPNPQGWPVSDPTPQELQVFCMHG